MTPPSFFRPARPAPGFVLALLAAALACAAHAQQHETAQAAPAAAPRAVPAPRAPAASAAQAGAAARGDAASPIRESLADQVRAVLEKDQGVRPRPRRGQPAAAPPVITVEVGRQGATAVRREAPLAPGNAPPADPVLGRQYLRARSIALTGQPPPPASLPMLGAAAAPPAAAAATAAAAGHAAAAALPHRAAGHWSYDGGTGPQAWAALHPDYQLCARGTRQSPVDIRSASTLLGPAEALQFHYRPSGGEVVHNGHTLQVDLDGINTLAVRGSVYRLVQFHFHHPAEETVDGRGHAMVAHLVHRNAQGQLAVVAVLMEPGEPSAWLDRVWTYMPLEVGDRVRMPADWLDMATLLPQDQRYYQFFGSLTTPPCTEGVLWLVLKQPVTVSREQLRPFAQLFPNNARPTQALNGRIVREAR